MTSLALPKEPVIQLVTDYLDTYDHWFASLLWNAPADYTFVRLAQGTLSKREQFQILEQLGWMVPAYGTCSELGEELSFLGRAIWKERDDYIVVYFDELAHRGEGKELHLLSLAKEWTPDLLCSLYRPAYNVPSFSDEEQRKHGVWTLRFLYIGNRCFCLRYANHDFWSWQSNKGQNIEITYLGEWHPLSIKRWDPVPLYAVDVTCVEEGGMIALDLNTAPQIRGTPLESLIPSKEIYHMIRDYLMKGKRYAA